MLIYSEKVLINDEFKTAYIEIKDDRIFKIHYKKPQNSKDILDFSGLYLLPGFVNIDSHFIQVQEEKGKDVEYHPLKNIEYTSVLNGITTLYHTVYFSRDDKDVYNNVKARIENILSYNESDLSLIDNKIHLKFEPTSIYTMDEIKLLVDEYPIDFISVEMFNKNKKNKRVKDKYIMYNMLENLELDEELANKAMEKIIDLREESCLDELSYLVKMAHYKGIELSTNSVSLIKKISREYKTNFDILTIDKENYKDIYSDELIYKRMQAEDIMSGRKECIDTILRYESSFITADSRPSNMLYSVKKLSHLIGLEKALALISKNVSMALGLKDTGSIKEGNLANFAVTRPIDGLPVVVSTICRGVEKIRILDKM